ncbi:MAG: Gfo/Idh/MocA family oxidoreductase [Clostridia bacterium]|nr:Gfo/Idh/MocA family oxidoreductase [Clostridia bacterium]
MFRICVVGCGNMARSGHGPAFAKYKKDYDGVCLAACCDLDASRAESFRDTFGFERCYTDFRKMLRCEQPDAVSLLSPVDLTCPLSVEIMKMGFHIIMEKPPGKNREEIETMIAQAKASGVHVRTAFNRRYMPLILELKKRLAETGERIIGITCQMYRYHRFEKDFSTTAIHAVDVVKNIAGADYREVSFVYDHHPELGENVKNIFMNASFTNGAYAQITFMPTGGSVVERITVNTLNNTFFVDLPVWNNMDVPGRLLHIRNDKTLADITGDVLSDNTDMYTLSGFYDENRLFFETIRAGEAAACDLQSAIQSVEIEDCIRHSLPYYRNEETLC